MIDSQSIAVACWYIFENDHVYSLFDILLIPVCLDAEHLRFCFWQGHYEIFLIWLCQLLGYFSQKASCHNIFWLACQKSHIPMDSDDTGIRPCHISVFYDADKSTNCLDIWGCRCVHKQAFIMPVILRTSRSRETESWVKIVDLFRHTDRSEF